MKKIKCPNCGSEKVRCMDGNGMVSKYGRNLMIDIAPDIWLCGDCKETFLMNDIGSDKKSDKANLER